MVSGEALGRIRRGQRVWRRGRQNRHLSGGFSAERMSTEFEYTEPINSAYVRWNLKEKCPAETDGISSDLIDQIIEQGRIRYKSEGVKQKAGLITGTHIRDRFNKRFDQRHLPDDPTTLDTDTFLKGDF